MPASSTTRRGTGAGHGGPARHGGSNSAARKPGPGRGITGRSVAELMAAQGARELAADRWLAILNDPTHPKHAEMVAKAAERMDGAAVQRNEISMRNVPAEQLTDDELAAIASRGSARAAGAATDTD